MLTIIVSKCKREVIDSMVKDFDIFISDKDIYPILNSESYFNGKEYSFYDIESFADEIVRISKEKKVLIHTFNPLILNFFEDDIARESFFIIKNKDKLIKFFDDERINEKLMCMNPGEAVVDTKFDE